MKGPELFTFLFCDFLQREPQDIPPMINQRARGEFEKLSNVVNCPSVMRRMETILYSHCYRKSAFYSLKMRYFYNL